MVTHGNYRIIITSFIIWLGNQNVAFIDWIQFYVVACFPGPQEATHHITHGVSSQGYRESAPGLFKSEAGGIRFFLGTRVLRRFPGAQVIGTWIPHNLWPTCWERGDRGNKNILRHLIFWCDELRGRCCKLEQLWPPPGPSWFTQPIMVSDRRCHSMLTVVEKDFRKLVVCRSTRLSRGLQVV